MRISCAISPGRSWRAAAEELRTRWKWGRGADRGRLDRHRPASDGWSRGRPSPPPEEKAEIERLATRHDELIDLDDEDWTAELVAEAEGLEARLDELHGAVEARVVYAREDMAVSGCIVTVGGDGDMRVIQGLVRPEDMPGGETGAADAAALGQAPGAPNGGYGEPGRIAAPAIAGPAAAPRRPGGRGAEGGRRRHRPGRRPARHPRGHRQGRPRPRLRRRLRPVAVPARTRGVRRGLP